MWVYVPYQSKKFLSYTRKAAATTVQLSGSQKKDCWPSWPCEPHRKAFRCGWLPRDAQHMTFHEEMRGCLGSSLQWLLLPLHFRIRLSTAGLHMELGHMLASAQLGMSIALPCLLRGGWHGGLPLLTWRRGLEWWGRLLPCRKPWLFF